MIFSVLTLFPGIFTSPLNESLLKKAIDRRIIDVRITNIRDFADDPHRTCDDSPYGGGAGMVMKIEPICRAMEHVERTAGRPRYVLLTPQGRIFDDEMARRFSRSAHLCLICGRYEGVDERIMEFVDEEVSIGSFVLSGGELPALLLIEAVSRFVPGVVGNDQSIAADSFGDGLLDYPHYTRPEVFRDLTVPPVLLSGNHEEVRRWRRKEALRKTLLRRPDLMDRFLPNEEDRRFLREILEEFPE